MEDCGETREEKRKLREEVRAWLRSLPEAEVQRRSQGVCARVGKRLAGGGFGWVATYAALPGEPDLAALWAGAGRFVFPKVTGEELTLWWVREPGGLTPGYRGIREPVEERCERVDPSEVGVILVPGLAFGEADGLRLGRGGGFYDRLLKEVRAPRWGICFEEQIRRIIPGEAHDVAMDVLISCEREVELVRHPRKGGASG